MEAAMKQIENRKKLLKNLSNREIAKVANIQTLSSDGLAKAKRAAELQARITNALARKTPGSLGLAVGPQARGRLFRTIFGFLFLNFSKNIF